MGTVARALFAARPGEKDSPAEWKAWAMTVNKVASEVNRLEGTRAEHYAFISVATGGRTEKYLDELANKKAA